MSHLDRPPAISSLEQSPRPQWKTKLIEAIQKVRSAHAAEYARTPDNSWMACLVTRISVLSGTLSLARKEGVPENDIAEASERVTDLLSKTRDYAIQYIDRTKPVPEEIKEELFTEYEALLPLLES